MSHEVAEAYADMAYLKTLYSATNDACTAAAQESIDDAVNWADLGCVSAERFTTHDGTTGYRVWIEEAAPEAYLLKEFVSLYLDAHGFKNVEIYTEW